AAVLVEAPAVVGARVGGDRPGQGGQPGLGGHGLRCVDGVFVDHPGPDQTGGDAVGAVQRDDEGLRGVEPLEPVHVVADGDVGGVGGAAGHQVVPGGAGTACPGQQPG